MRKIILSLSLIILAVGLAQAKKAPDFKYPETVITDAAKQIDKALRKNDGRSLVDGLVKLSLAKSYVSADYMPEMVHYVDSLASRVPDRRTKAIVRLLEADMYGAFYNKNSYKYRNRTEVRDVVSDDMREWSQADFYWKMTALSDSIFRDADLLFSTDVKDYEKIFVLPEDCPEFTPTLLDAIAYRMIDNLVAVSDDDAPMRPFRGCNDFVASVGDEPSTAIDKIFRLLLTKHRRGSAAFIYAELQRVANEDYDDDEEEEIADYLLQFYRENEQSPYSVEILSEWLDLQEYVSKMTNLPDSENVSGFPIEIIRQAVDRFPDYKRINKLRNVLALFEQQRVGIEVQDMALSTDSIIVKMLAVRNVDRVTLKVYRKPEGYERDGRKTVAEVLNDLEEIYSQEVIDAKRGVEISLPPLSVGRYVVVPQYKDLKTGEMRLPDASNYDHDIRVTDLDVWAVRMHKRGEFRAYVVDAATSGPVEGAVVHVVDRDGEKEISKSTNKFGYVVFDSTLYKRGNSVRIYATHGDDCSDTRSYYFYSYGEDSRMWHAKVFTDRGVYRPGETVKFAVVAYVAGDRLLEVEAGKTLNAKLGDSNGNWISSMDLIADRFGRCDSCFVVPETLKTGQYSIAVFDPASGDNLGSMRFHVSEYKAPTFFIEYDPEASSLIDMDSLAVGGTIRTYSQAPVAGATIEYEFRQRDTYWMETSDRFLPQSGTVVTDSAGRWSIPMPKSWFDDSDEQYKLYLYLQATDARGETQTLDKNIIVGKGGYKFFLTQESCVADSVAGVPVRVYFGDNGVDDADVHYRVRACDKDSTVVASGVFRSGRPAVDVSAIPSGMYDMQLYFAREKSDTAALRLIVTHEADTLPPFETPFFLAQQLPEVQCAPDGSFTFRYGNSCDNYFYYVVSCAGDVVDEGWHFQKAGMHEFAGRAKFADKERSEIVIYQMNRHCLSETQIHLLPAVPQDSIEITTETFRDKVVPGGKETWTLRVKSNNGKRFRTAVIANMYDAALNPIASNLYDFHPYAGGGAMPGWMLAAPRGSVGTYLIYCVSDMEWYPMEYFTPPHLNMYGKRYFYNVPSDAVFHSTVAFPVAKEEVFETKVLRTNSVAADAMLAGTSDGMSSGGASEMPLRDDAVKTAFFLPGLVASEDGEVTFTFDVPDRNTQWQFTAVAYTEDLLTASIDRLVSASKPLMIEPNMPRFVRDGDSLTIKAAVMNATDADQVVDVHFEIENEGRVVEKDFAGVKLAARGSAMVEMPFVVDGGEMIICKTTVSNGEGVSDGERNAIAVLPAESEAIDAVPFYLSGAKKKEVVSVPHFKKGSVTFEYSDNPVWYAAMALPAVVSESSTARSFAANYYATALADFVVRENPIVAEALKSWGASRSLESPLQSNEELKLLSLAVTPWTAAAKTETEAMSQLSKLADPATMQYRKQQALIALADLQNADGGFAWIRGAKSSPMVTIDILRLCGQLREAGCEETETDMLLRDIMKKSVAYCDKLLAKQAVEQQDSDKIFARASDYVAVRTSLGVPALPDSLQWVVDGVIDRAKRHWGDYSIVDKANAAVMLSAYGERDEALRILESIRQFARTSAMQGMYWDVEADKTATAVAALRAFRTLAPDDSKTVEGVIRWLLLQKETQCWSTSSLTCDAVAAILSCGGKWLAAGGDVPEISIGGVAVDMEGATPYVGYVKRTFDAGMMKSGEVEISRSSSAPAWGAVYCRYRAPMAQVGKHSTTDVRIEKQLLVYDAEGNVRETDTFAVGDRVQVRLTIRSERDLEFVTIADERAACFEPVDQKEAYEWKDGIGVCRETRDASTNLFITRLPKGTYVATYDVFVNNQGSFASGIATLQCQYAPQITAHSSGATVVVK